MHCQPSLICTFKVYVLAVPIWRNTSHGVDTAADALCPVETVAGTALHFIQWQFDALELVKASPHMHRGRSWRQQLDATVLVQLFLRILMLHLLLLISLTYFKVITPVLVT